MTLLQDTLTWHRSLTQTLPLKLQYNCGDTDHSHRHLLCRHQNNCGDTDHSHRHLLCKGQYNCGDADHSHRHLLCRHQNNCNDTDHSHRHLLSKRQYNCGGTDHSHRHLLCRHQYNCDGTDHSHRHLLSKRQYNCGDTDHSHRHLLCKHQNICGATTQLDTLSGPLQTHSPLWRALRPSRGRLRTVADGCERKRKTWRTQPHPQTPKWNGNPRYAFGKKTQRRRKFASVSFHLEGPGLWLDALLLDTYDLTLLWDSLAWHFVFEWDILLIWHSCGHSCKTLLLDTLVRHSYLTFL